MSKCCQLNALSRCALTVISTKSYSIRQKPHAADIRALGMLCEGILELGGAFRVD
jgi:hypothetical protein